MLAEENKLLVSRVVDEAQCNGNLSVIDEIFAEDFVDHTPMPGLPPTRDGIRLLFAGPRNSFPDLAVAVSEQIADDYKVATRKTFSGTHRGDFLGIPPTGRDVSFEVIDILTIQNRKIVEHRVVFDRLGLLQQLGALPA